MVVLEEFLRPTQKGLFKMLGKMFEGKTYKREQGFILVKGEVPIMLIAHLDTVHKEPVKNICKSKDKKILMSPQGIGGDDRCGVYALVKTYELSKAKPWLLFCCDEEVGGLGARCFCTEHQNKNLPEGVDTLKLLIEIDRRGSNDAVFYECGNIEFEKYITSKGFQTAYGSFSDISIIAPELGVAAVNLSSGYYNAHCLHEYINRQELNAVIDKVVEIVSDAAKDNFPKYVYVEKAYKPSKLYGDWYLCGQSKTSVKSETDLYMWNDDFYKRKKLPSEYEQLYGELLEIYTVDELEEFRGSYGDEVIYQIYIDEFGPFYADCEK